MKEVGTFKGLAKVFNQAELAMHKMKIKEMDEVIKGLIKNVYQMKKG